MRCSKDFHLMVFNFKNVFNACAVKFKNIQNSSASIENDDDDALKASTRLAGWLAKAGEE